MIQTLNLQDIMLTTSCFLASLSFFACLRAVHESVPLEGLLRTYKWPYMTAFQVITWPKLEQICLS